MFAAAEAGLGHSLIGGEEQLMFLGILAIGFVFEGVLETARQRCDCRPVPASLAERVQQHEYAGL